MYNDMTRSQEFFFFFLIKKGTETPIVSSKLGTGECGLAE